MHSLPSQTGPVLKIEKHNSFILLRLGTDELLPVDLSVLVEVLQSFQNILQHRGYGGLVQDAGLVLPSGDDVFDHVQHGAWT